MFENFKVVLLRHHKFLVIFFIVIFLPSILLAYFGIRSLQNEQYKLQQQTLERQRAFARSVSAGVTAFLEKNLLGMQELCRSPAISSRDYEAFRESVFRRLRDGSISGQIVFWSADKPSWMIDWHKRPPASIAFRIPAEWRNLSVELAEAESAEFRDRDYSRAVSLYEGFLDRAENRYVKAWMLGRVARCEVKKGDLVRAIAIYRRIIADYEDMPTETGRPLELVSRLEVLKALATLKQSEDFAAESLEAYRELSENKWSLDGDQVDAYAQLLDGVTSQAANDSSHPDLAIDRARAVINEKLSNWRLAEEMRHSILPELREIPEHWDQGGFQVQKRAIEFEDQEVLALAAPLDPYGPGGHKEFLVSLLRMDDLKPVLEALVSQNRPPDASLRIRSVLSENVLFEGAEAPREGQPGVTDFFPENFPPWRLEAFRNDSGTTGVLLYQNIFFWTILALLVILFFGSGLIIRTIVQEVRLLNLKSEFIASVSHEFKTPLTSMGAILEHLLDGETKDPEKTREYYGILQHSSDRLKRLVGNILDFSKIEEGRKTYRLRPADPVELVKREIRSFERETGMESLTIGLECDASIPKIAVDEEAAGQALHNILDNAVKFSPGEKKIDVEIRNLRGAVEISVQDPGIGIPESERKRIFEKFYRGGRASSVSPTGTGLGLALVKHIMDAHGGDIVIKSRPGEGTRVSLVLPVAEGVQ